MAGGKIGRVSISATRYRAVRDTGQRGYCVQCIANSIQLLCGRMTEINLDEWEIRYVTDRDAPVGTSGE